MLDGLETISPSTLTTDAETISGNNITVNGTLDNTPTLTAADSITGTGGTNIMNVTATATVADATNGALISGMGTYNVRSTGAATTFSTLDATKLAGTTAVNANLSTGDLTVTGLATGASVGIIGNGAMTSGAVALAYDTASSAVTLNLSGGVKQAAGDALAHSGVTAGKGIIVTNGTAASATINSNGAVANAVGGVSLAAGTANITSLTINAAASLTVAPSSGAAITGWKTSGTANTITINGAASTVPTGQTAAVNIGTLDAAVNVVNASGLTAGGVSLALSSVTQTITGGAGNDAISSGQTLTTGSVNAGAGTADILYVTNTNATNSTTLGGKYSGFEILGVSSGVTVDVDNLTANNTFTGLTVAGGSGNAIVQDMTATMAANVTVSAGISGSGTLQFGIKNATSPSTNNTLVITANDSTSTVQTVALGTFTANGVENITLNALNENIAVAALTSAADLEALTLTGAKTQSITTGAFTVLPNFVLNASAMTGAFTFDGNLSTTRGMALTAGSGNDNITMSNAGVIDTVILGTGNDTIYADGKGTAGVDTLTIATDSGTAGAVTVTINGVATAYTVASSTSVATQTTELTALLNENTTLTDAGFTFSGVTATGVITITANQQSGALTVTATETTAVASTYTVAIATTGVLASSAKDTITLGDGNDVAYVLSATQANTDVYVGVDFGSSTATVDTFNFTDLGATKVVQTVSDAQATTIAAKSTLAAAVEYVLTNVALDDGNASIFTYASKNYLIVNADGGDAWSDTVDAMIEITGYTGTLNTTDFNFI